MNPAQDPKSSQPAETDRIQFLLSRYLDGDLTLEESSELAALQQSDADRAFLAAMTELRGQLKALPVKRVSESFATSVHDAIHKASTTVSAISAPNAQRGRMMKGIVAVSVTACAAALMLFLRSRDVEHAVGPAQIADAAADQNAIAQQEEMRPFMETDKWSIVVVTVNSKDRDEVMRILETIVAKNGMEIKSVVGNDHHDARFGVLFTSTGANDNAFIESVISETNAQSANWNPQSVADSTSDSFIHRVQESLKTPTLSELHFGKVYMALLKSSKQPAAASYSRLAKNDAVDGASLPSTAAKKTTELPNEVAAALTPRKTPVLVVFELTGKAAENI